MPKINAIFIITAISLSVVMLAGTVLIIHRNLQTNLYSQASGHCSGSGGICQGSSGCNSFDSSYECGLNQCTWVSCSQQTSSSTCNNLPGCTWNDAAPTPTPLPACNYPYHECTPSNLCSANGGQIKLGFACGGEVCCDWGPPAPTLPPPVPTSASTPVGGSAPSNACRYCVDANTPEGICETRNPPCIPDINQCETNAECRPILSPTPLPIGGSMVMCNFSGDTSDGSLCEGDDSCCAVSPGSSCSYLNSLGQLQSGSCFAEGSVEIIGIVDSVVCRCLTEANSQPSSPNTCRGSFSFSNPGVCASDGPNAIVGITAHFTPTQDSNCNNQSIGLSINSNYSGTISLSESYIGPDADGATITASYRPYIVGEICSQSTTLVVTAHAPNPADNASTATLSSCPLWSGCAEYNPTPTPNPKASQCQIGDEAGLNCGSTDNRCCSKTIGSSCGDGLTCNSFSQDIDGFQICSCAGAAPIPSATSSPDISGPNGTPDGKVNGLDYATFYPQWDQCSEKSKLNCDLNNDTCCDSLDYVILYQNWNRL